jgi:hypothetical protein
MDRKEAADVPVLARPRERGLKPERGAERATRRSAAEPRLILVKARFGSATLVRLCVSRRLRCLWCEIANAWQETAVS